MADKKISELTALTSTASGDLFAVVDASATETKYVARANIFGQDLTSSSTPTLQNLSIIGSSTVGNLSLLDSTGTAGGRVVGDGDNKIGLRAGASGYVNVFEVRGDLNQAVLVLNSTQQALFTTSGTTLTGNLTVDTTTLHVDSANNRVGFGTTSPDVRFHLKQGSSGATAYGYSDFYLESSSVTGFNFLHADANAAGIYWSTPSDSLGAEIRWKYSDNEFRIGARSTNGFMSLYAGNSERARVHANGDFDVGTDVLFVDVSTGFTGFGTNSPIYNVDIRDTAAANAQIRSTGNDASLYLRAADASNSTIYLGDTTDFDVAYLRYNHSTNAMTLISNATYVLGVSSTGELNFGTHSVIAAETVTGYITIRDIGGTTRKLAVVS